MCLMARSPWPSVTHAHTLPHTHTYIYTYTHAYTHTYTHTHTALLPFGGHVQAHWEMAGNRLPGFLVKCIEAVDKRGAAQGPSALCKRERECVRVYVSLRRPVRESSG
jgi:hypothetical protein